MGRSNRDGAKRITRSREGCWSCKGVLAYYMFGKNLTDKRHLKNVVENAQVSSFSPLQRNHDNNCKSKENDRPVLAVSDGIWNVNMGHASYGKTMRSCSASRSAELAWRIGFQKTETQAVTIVLHLSMAIDLTELPRKESPFHNSAAVSRPGEISEHYFQGYWTILCPI